MKDTLKLLAPFGALLLMTASNAGATVTSPSHAATLSAPRTSNHLKMGAFNAPGTPVCTDRRPGFAHCLVLLRNNGGGGQPDVSGYGPSDLSSAYNIPAGGGTGQVVAIVDAFDNPNVASDLAAYRSNFGLPTANFTKYNQTGQQSNYPSGNTGWGVEIDLDVEMVSAACPNCTIILVEATTNSTANLDAAENEAATLGANVISNSFSGSGDSASAYNHKHVTILASAGDDGYGIGDPADFGTVVAVGGTTLVHSPSGSRAWTETAWSGTGSGCSSQPKPKWQTDTGCTHRTANDVSAVANPNTGVAEYDTYGHSGWFVVGGTSVSSPYLGGVFGAAGNAKKQKGGKTFWETKHHADLYDIVSGSNGSCNPSYLCTAGPGYDGPTGWGTPNGLGAF